ncbi:MAG: hypothetical protein R3F44_16365, partial [Candidatus Competibacteraceae bacterium]
AGFQQHCRSPRERPADQQAAHVVVIPHPTALEVGKLNLALDDAGGGFRKQALGTFERARKIEALSRKLRKQK